MEYINWLEQEEELSSGGLTVRAQVIDPNDNGRLLWDTLFPREDVDDIDLDSLTTVDIRPVADRREWNAPGRYVPIITPNLGKVSLTPIEAYHLIDEHELTKLRLQTMGNRDVFRQRLGAPIPRRVDRLAEADYRRVEVDAFTAWVLNQITVRNPQLGHTTTVSFQFDTGRYQTAGTPWSDPSVNAYDEFIAWVEDAISTLGGIRGVMLSRASRKAIQQDAPRPLGNVGPRLTRAQLVDQVSGDLGVEFNFYENDTTLGIFPDAGTDMVNTRVFPAQRIAAIPMGDIGTTAFAPVTRAMDLATAIPDAEIDVRGVTVFYLPHNDGKEIKVQAQLNAMTVPNEQAIWVMNIGV